MPCTAPIIPLLDPFRPVFTAPTWKKLLTLLSGTLLARGRRTVTAALWYTGQEQDPHFSTFHQALNRAGPAGPRCKRVDTCSHSSARPLFPPAAPGIS
jgi:hypothetical protein